MFVCDGVCGISSIPAYSALVCVYFTLVPRLFSISLEDGGRQNRSLLLPKQNKVVDTKKMKTMNTRFAYRAAHNDATCQQPSTHL